MVLATASTKAERYLYIKSSSSLVDDANYFVRPLLLGEDRIWPRNFSKLWKAYHLLLAVVKVGRVGEMHRWRWDSLLFQRERSYSLQETSQNNKKAVALTPIISACSLKLLNSLFAVDAEFRKKANALEALAALEANIPLPNGDGPYQSLLRRYYGEEEMVNAVVRFASSRPAKHIGGDCKSVSLQNMEALIPLSKIIT